MMINLSKSEAQFLAKLSGHTCQRDMYSIGGKLAKLGFYWDWDKKLWKETNYKFEDA